MDQPDGLGRSRPTTAGTDAGIGSDRSRNLYERVGGSLRNRQALLKPLKLEKGRDDLQALLRSAADGTPRVLDYLFGLGAEPNDKANGGSSVLETAITRLGRYAASVRQVKPRQQRD